MNSKKFNPLTLGLIFIILVPNLRDLYKYFPSFQPFMSVLYCIAFIGFLYLLQLERFAKTLNKWVGNYWYISLIFLLVTALVWYLYPIADGLKFQMKGSDQDDCVIMGGLRVLSFLHKLPESSYLGNPCSTGLGIILLYLPFIFFGVYHFGAIFISLITVYFFKKFTKDFYATAIFTTLLFSSLFSLDLLSVGSDLIFIGCGIVIISLGAVHTVTHKKISYLLCLAIFSGLISTTRITFLFITPLLSILIFFYWKKGGVIFLLLSTSAAIFPSTILYFIDPASTYSQWHLLGKGRSLLQGSPLVIIAAVCLTSFCIGIYLAKKLISNIPLAVLLFLAPILATLSLSDLVLRSGNFAVWEGANYLMPVLPLSIAILTTRLVLKR